MEAGPEEAKSRAHGSRWAKIRKITLDGSGVIHIFSLGVVLPYPKTALHVVAFEGSKRNFPSPAILLRFPAVYGI
jgi:hypothetical protein